MSFFACAKFSIDCRKQGDVLRETWPLRSPIAIGTSKPSRALRIVSSSKLAGAPGDVAFEHFAEDDAADAFELARLAQLPQHAVDLVRLRCHIFKEKQLAFGVWLPWRAEQGNENAEAAAVKRAARSTGFQGAQAFGGSESVGRAGERRLKAREVHAVFEIEIRSNHRAVKCGQSELIEETQLQAGHVAVSKEGLGVLPDERQIDALEQVV